MKNTRSIIIASFLALLVLPIAISAQSMPPQFKKAVAFVFGRTHLKGPDGRLVLDSRGRPLEIDKPLGTAFFVAYPDTRGGPDSAFGYAATARHVLKDVDGQFLKSVKLRLNLLDLKADPGFDYIELPVKDDESNLVWLSDSEDPANEVVAFPIVPDVKRFDFDMVPVSLIGDEAYLRTQKIAEGDPLVFVGLLPQYYGAKKNFPVVRKGSLALVTDERVPTPSGPQKVIFAEIFSWPGNSGAPVFLGPVGVSRPEVIIVGPDPPLLGMVLGHYGNAHEGETVEAATLVFGDRANIGIAFLAPAASVRRVIESAQAQRLRDLEIKKLNKGR